MKTWQPLYSGEAANVVFARIQRVMDALAPWRQRALSSGDWGIPLLDLYGSLTGFREVDDSQLREATENMANVLARARRPWLFGQGWAGSAWLLSHFERQTNKTYFDFAEVYEALDEVLQVRPWTFQYDLISGFVGLAVFFLEHGQGQSAESKRCLSRVVDLIIESREETRDGTTWHTRPSLLPEWQRQISPGGYYNVGVAHGMPGVLWVLARCQRFGIGSDLARTTLESGVDWLLKQRAESDSLFPSWITPGQPARPGGFSWCYGGLGISLTLLSVALDSQRDDWFAAAVEIGKREAARSVAPNDAGVCHGFAGVAHLFNRLYQHTRDEEFAEHARIWYERSLAFDSQPQPGIGGYQSRTSDMQIPARFRFEDDADFLTGASGTALALLAAVTPTEPLWDHVLLIPALSQGRDPD